MSVAIDPQSRKIHCECRKYLRDLKVIFANLSPTFAKFAKLKGVSCDIHSNLRDQDVPFAKFMAVIAKFANDRGQLATFCEVHG
jgi:hypothetical protein